MAADAQQLFDLFDSYWFTHQVFKKNQNPPPKTHKNQQSIIETYQTIDFQDSNKQQQSDSPNFVLNLYSPKLETIFSGKESKEIEEQAPPVKEKKRAQGRAKERKKNNSKSKSLSELEFEELKGFMDLGFLFSEKDKDSNLVSIIPGLQRLGKVDCKDEHKDVASLRPYLSEAWDDFENKRREEPIRIPAFGNEVEIKDQLKFWAHSVVASVVR